MAVGTQHHREEIAVPHVIVKLWPGKSEKQKRKLAEEITRSVMSTLHYGAESISVAFEEVEARHWATKVYQTHIVGHEDELYKKPDYMMPD
jgi:4-oxalocrotonate tautomerase